MSEKKSNWDPFQQIFRRQPQKRSSVRVTGIETERKDELFAKIREMSDIYRKSKRNSNQTIDWSFEGMDISVSSDDDSEDNSLIPNIGSPVQTLNSVSGIQLETTLSSFDSDHQILSDSHKESDQHFSENISDCPTISGETNGLRRSKRKRLPVMESWRGQRPIYKRDSTGITEAIVDVEEGTHYEINFGTRNRKRKRKIENESNKSLNIFNLSIHNKRLKIKDENKNPVNIQSIENLKWKKSTQSKGVDIAIINKNKVKREAIGMIRIKGSALKTKSQTGDYVTNIIIFFGVLSLKIEDNEEVFVRTGDSFAVMQKTNYSLVNLRKDMAYISFTLFSD